MSKLTWKVSRPLSDKHQIKKLEEILGVTMPDDYIECVMKNNAGYPSLKIFTTDVENEHVFNNLLTFDESKSVNIFNTYKSVLAASGNKELLPFAEDPFGNYICFDFSESSVKIVYWEHETQKTETVCTTFTEFLAKLGPTE